MGADSLRQVLGVVADESEQRGSARVQPRKSEEVEAGILGHPAPLDDLSARFGNRHLHERMVEAETRKSPGLYGSPRTKL